MYKMVLWNFMLNQNLSCSRPSTTWSICVLLAFNTCSYASWRWCSAVGCCRGCAIGITWTLCIETEKTFYFNQWCNILLYDMYIYIVFSYSFACRSSCSRASERVGVDATGGCNAILAACTSWGSTLARIRGTCIWRISITPNTTTKTLAYPKTRKRA